MSTLYITEPNTVVRLSSRTLQITKGKEKIAQMPLIRLDNILIFGNAQISTQAMAALLEEGIDVSFLSRNGRLRGRLASAMSKNVLLRIAQYERHLDDEFQLDLARTIVKAKIRNGRKVIQRFLNNHPEFDFAKELQLIGETLKKLDNQRSVNSLMGAEGIAGAAYFQAFGQMFLKDFQFQTRTRRPPKDPVNALLSFGYTLLTNEILALITAHGLDPHIGFLHGIVYGRPSLALDIVEEFRHPVIDRFVLSLLNHKKLQHNDFEEKENGVYLNTDGRKTFFKYYDELMQRAVRGENPRLDLRALLKRQVRAIAATIKSSAPYKPYQFRA